MTKMTRTALYVILLGACTLAHGQGVPPLAGAKRFTTLIVETVFPYSVQPYASHAPLSLAEVPHTQASPEATLLEMLASMRSGDWGWNSSLWAPDSIKEMNARDLASHTTPADWVKRWRQRPPYAYQLLSRVEYGKYVLIHYEQKAAGAKKGSSDTMALENIGGKWYLTQALAADPILMHWNAPSGRVQVAPNTLFNK
jgi:hypothetical protein